MEHLYILFFMKVESTCSCLMPIFESNAKYCCYCIRENEWDLFLKPQKKSKNLHKPIEDRMEVEKKIAKLIEALKEAKKELTAVKRREKDETRMEEEQQDYINRFISNVPQMQNKIQKKLMA